MTTDRTMRGYIVRMDEKGVWQNLECSLYLSGEHGSVYFISRTPAIGLGDNKFHSVTELQFRVRRIINELNSDAFCFHVYMQDPTNPKAFFDDGFTFYASFPRDFVFEQTRLLKEELKEAKKKLAEYESNVIHCPEKFLAEQAEKRNAA